MISTCTIVPESVLKRFADDPELSAELRQHFRNALAIDAQMRAVRQTATQLTLEAARVNQLAGFAPTAVAAAPAITLFDCKHSTALPGAPIANPGSSPDATAKRTLTETTDGPLGRRSTIVGVPLRAVANFAESLI